MGNVPRQLVEEPFYPFQMIAADFIVVKGMEFLVIVNCCSNYTIVYRLPSLSSAGVVGVMKNIFNTFGVLE